MKVFVCNKCGYNEEIDDNQEISYCPNCGFLDEFNISDSALADNEIDAIIDSVLEDVLEVSNSKIINRNEIDKFLEISSDNPLINRNEEKCSNCGLCKRICEKAANLTYNLNETDKPLCINCGHCVINCPTGALSFKTNYKEVKSIIDKNEKIVVALVDPTTYLSLNKDLSYEKKMVTALRNVGFDFVFNTGFASDVKVLEDVTEFAERLKNKAMLPMITSSCPAWINYANIYHKELLNNISTSKTSSQIHSSLIKTYFCEEKGFDPSKIVTVSITTCTAKSELEPDKYMVDYNLTLNELLMLFREEEIDIDSLEEKEYDTMLSENSGSSYLLGVVGGESEAFSRTFYRIMSKTNLNKENMIIKELRNVDGIKDASIQVGEDKLRIAVVEGLVNFEKLLINKRYKRYHYIEVMTCKNGCIGGAGNIFNIEKQVLNDRKVSIYTADEEKNIRCAHDNAELKVLYRKYLKKPLNEKCKEILHNTYVDTNN